MKEIPLYKLRLEELSTEDDLRNKTVDKNKKGMEKSIFDKLKELPSKISNMNKKSQLFFNKRKNLGFYKKYLGRVESGLYTRYGSEATITENKMIDDPVTILKGPARNYIRDIVKDINKLYNDFNKVCKQLEGKTTSEECIRIIKPYANKLLTKNLQGDSVDKEELSWKKRIHDATKLKIANILLRNGNREVYGYTAENMVLKKYPPPNHLIVTLFVENPEEKPEQQSVHDVFKSVDSFKILANSDKNDVFNIQNMNRAVMEQTVDGNIINEIKDFRSNSVSKFKNAINNEMTKEDIKKEARIIESIWDGIKASSKELISKKVYIIDCINVYFDMVMRIDKLAVKSIESMLDVESKYKDSKYKPGLKYAKEKKESNEDSDSSSGYTKDRAKELKNIANNLNKR